MHGNIFQILSKSFQIHFQDPFKSSQYFQYFMTESALLQSVLSDTFSTFRAQKKPETPNLHFDS